MNETTVSSGSHAASAASERLAFIDIMRGVACVWMIQTHIVNACLNPEYRSSWFFTPLNTSNGYVSVSFIFCAGAGFWLAASRKIQEYKAFQPSLWQYVRRLGFILLVGYWLHIPEISFRKYLLATPARQNILWICDVLHAIVVASFLALAVAMLAPRLKTARWAYLALGAAFIFAAPLVWQLEPDTFLPRALGSYISRPPAAAFPIFPWCGYFFVGAALTAFFMDSPNRRAFATKAAVTAFCAPFLVMTFKETGWSDMFSYGWTENWYLCSPGNAIFRVSGSVLLFSLLYLQQDRITSWTIFGRKPAAYFQIMGKESLFVYVSHLMIVYGSPVNLGLSFLVGRVMRPLPAFIITLAIIAVVYVLTEYWHAFKKQAPAAPKRIIRAFAVLFALIFLIVTPEFADMAEAWAAKYLLGVFR
jgi:uncharacterized membrane protein